MAAPSTKVPTPIEIVFKEVDGVEIAMDVYIPENVTKEKPVPVLLWWHGGGLLQGTRKAISPHMLRAPSTYNLCLISVDYRLAPQTRLPSILSDCKSALDYLQTSSFSSLTNDRVDVTRVIVSGSSAGGWLALLAGTGIGYEISGLERPKGIKGVVALYPITDLLDDFWINKQRPLVYMDRLIEKEEVETFLDPSSEKTSWSAADGKRSIFYHYMVQEALLQQLLLEGTNIDPINYSIAQNIRTGKFSIPPTYIVHGNIDTKVPHQQSLDVLDAYKHIGADALVEYQELDGLDHGFEREEGYDMLDMYTFIQKVI